MNKFELHAVEQEDGDINITLDGEREDTMNVIGELIIAISDQEGLPPALVARLALECAEEKHPEYKTCGTPMPVPFAKRTRSYVGGNREK